MKKFLFLAIGLLMFVAERESLALAAGRRSTDGNGLRLCGLHR